MKVTGTVTKRLSEKNILVKIIRSSACGGNCHTCGVCHGGEAEIIAECTDRVQEGDEVWVTIPNKRYFTISFAVFLLPLLVMIFAFWLCRQSCSEDISALVSLLVGILSFLVITLLFRRLKNPKATRKEE